MIRGDWPAGSAVLAALYLPCGEWSMPHARRWPRVAEVLGPELRGAEHALRGAGLWEEAACLAQPGRLAWGEHQVHTRSVLTAFDPAYPAGWLEALGDSAPPALWRRGDIPGGKSVGVVGSRQLRPASARFASALGAYLASRGFSLVSGAAHGADLSITRAHDSAQGAGVVQILPCGIERAAQRVRAQGCSIPGAWLSPFEPMAPFSGAQAMLRNRLIYAWSRRSIVLESRLQVGGTWGGAVEALRRRTGQVVVLDWADPASRALRALGAEPLEPTPGWGVRLSLLLGRPLPLTQPDLFGVGAVRESPRRYFVAG